MALLSLLLFVRTPPSFSQTSSKIPFEYGEIVFQQNETSANQVFIIGISHRDALTLVNDGSTSKVQADVYRIGDWYIRNTGVELLLPEGFFNVKRPEASNMMAGVSRRVNHTEPWNHKSLDERLSSNDTFVNAEMLLMESHHLRAGQVEDKNLYDAVTRTLMKLMSTDPGCDEYGVIKSEIESLQDRRTAVMLQNIPGIIEDQFRKGYIKTRKAIFTIGISHIPKIIEYLTVNNLAVAAKPASQKNDGREGEADLDEKLGISIVIPRTLLDDQPVMNMIGLHKLVVQSHGGLIQ